MNKEKKHGLKHIGKKFKSNQGCDVEVIDGSSKPGYVTISINGDGLQEYITETPYNAVVKGKVKHPYHPSVCGIGYVGVGKYKSKENHKHTKAYEKWNGMIQRCYSDKLHKKHPTYKGVTVCSKWHNFQNFAEWFEEHYVEAYDLNKGLLALPNTPKQYCESTCVFISHALNTFLTSIGSIGYYKQLSGRYMARISVDGKIRRLGMYDTPEEASKAYKEARAQQALKWQLRMRKEWKVYLESKDKSISGKYQRAIDNIM